MAIIHYFKRFFLFLLAMSFLAGCATVNQQYYWNSYEGLIYDMYNKPGKATPDVQIDKLTRDIQKAESVGRPTPPGVYAHLGFMYAAQGNMEKAEAAFNEEKTLYPESEVLINGMLERSKKTDTSN